MTSPNLLLDPTVRTITVGDLSATFLPQHGMLGASLRYKGVELLRRLDNLEAAGQKGSTAGIPVLYPWANRLATLAFSVESKTVALSADSALLHFDDRGLPMHGATWALLEWGTVRSTGDSLSARLDWNRDALLAIFPFPHHVDLTAKVDTNSLLIETVVVSHDQPVPVSFGFHPYFGIPNLPRSEWHLKLPAMRRLIPDSRGIPTDEEVPFAGFDSVLAESSFDDLFAVAAPAPTFTLSGAGYSLAVEFLEGYGYAQIYAPKGKEFIALEPMTAPTNALCSGRGLQFAPPHREYRASFRIRISS